MEGGHFIYYCHTHTYNLKSRLTGAILESIKSYTLIRSCVTYVRSPLSLSLKFSVCCSVISHRTYSGTVHHSTLRYETAVTKHSRYLRAIDLCWFVLSCHPSSSVALILQRRTDIPRVSIVQC